jgi:hypothetical protein
MKRLLAAAVVIVTTGAMALAQGGVEKAVMDLEHQWTKAGLASNGAASVTLK